MTVWWLVMTFVVLAAAGAAISGWLRHVLIRSSVLDRPNARSLHVEAVPRGGGLGFAVLVLAVEVALVVAGLLPREIGLALVGVGAGFAVLGWADDYQARPVSWRLLAQSVLAAAFALVVLRGAPAGLLAVVGYSLAFTLSLIAIVWFVNLFNFMDGADGFAGTQTLTAAAGAAVIFWISDEIGAALAMTALAGSSAGFLRWNWPPARIFMGDAGSYFVGFQFAAFMLIGAQSTVGIAPVLILSAPFVTDATLTLMRRMVARERWWQPHRSHVYQLLILGGCAPATLARRLAILNITVCWSLAFISATSTYRAVTCGLIAYAVTAIIWAVVFHFYRNSPDTPRV